MFSPALRPPHWLPADDEPSTAADASPALLTAPPTAAPSPSLPPSEALCQPSIRVRRRPSVSNSIRHAVPTRARSVSQPPAPQSPSPFLAFVRSATSSGLSEGSPSPMAEDGLRPPIRIADHSVSLQPTTPAVDAASSRRLRLGRLLRPTLHRQGPFTEPSLGPEYDDKLVDVLDIINPEVQTLSTLTNVQNSLFVPDLGGLINRRPTYVLSGDDPSPSDTTSDYDGFQPSKAYQDPLPSTKQHAPAPQRSDTITSRLSASHFAALPPGITLEGWSEAEKCQLDDCVRHMLHSRRSKFKQRMAGFGKFVRRPLGFFVTLYASLITLFGLAWVLFLIGWIYVGERQIYVIHVIDSVLVALFAVVGIGMAPFRAIDTYHMAFVAHYSRLIRRAARQRHRDATLKQTISPPDADQPPHPRSISKGGDGNRSQPLDPMLDLEADLSSSSDPLHPLTAKQRLRLMHHQKRLAKSHSFYKPTETSTHCSFPLSYLIAIVVLLDMHSCLQIALSACTWGIDYRVRPFALTTVILCLSISCSIAAGIVILVGGRTTRKKEVTRLLKRQALTGVAMAHITHKREKKDPRERSLPRQVDGLPG